MLNRKFLKLFTEFSLRHRERIFLQLKPLLNFSQLKRFPLINHYATMPPKAQSILPFGKTTQSSSSNKRNSSAIDLEASEIDSQASINSTLAPPETSNIPSETFEPLQKPPNKKTLRSVSNNLINYNYWPVIKLN